MPVSERAGNLWEVWLDPTCVEIKGENLFPFLPYGQLNPFYLEAFRVAHYWHGKAIDSVIPVSLSQAYSPDPLSKLVVVVCGKYIPREIYDNFHKALSEGKRLLFVYGLPVYDEKMETLKWSSGPVSTMRSFDATDPFLQTKDSAKKWVETANV